MKRVRVTPAPAWGRGQPPDNARPLDDKTGGEWASWVGLQGPPSHPTCLTSDLLWPEAKAFDEDDAGRSAP